MHYFFNIVCLNRTFMVRAWRAVLVQCFVANVLSMFPNIFKRVTVWILSRLISRHVSPPFARLASKWLQILKKVYLKSLLFDLRDLLARWLPRKIHSGCARAECLRSLAENLRQPTICVVDCAAGRDQCDDDTPLTPNGDTGLARFGWYPVPQPLRMQLD